MLKFLRRRGRPALVGRRHGRRRRGRQESPHLGRRRGVARRRRSRRRRLSGHGGVDGGHRGRLVLGVLQDVEVRHVVAHHAAVVVVVLLGVVEAGRSRRSRLLEDAEKGGEVS